MAKNDSSPSPRLNNEQKLPSLARRCFLKAARSFTLSALTAPIILIPRSRQLLTETIFPCNMPQKKEEPKVSLAKPKQDHFLSFVNIHTGESLHKCLFWSDGSYDEEALKKINHFFRDHRTHDERAVDRDLLHLLHNIARKLETHEPIHLISGYRSPKSNTMLRSHSSGVARNSQHLYGKAADIMIPGRTLKQVQLAAKSFQAGGVGRYTSFVHVDTGRVRYWGLT